MRILILNQYYVGENEPGSLRTHEHSLYLSLLGHEVEVFAGTANALTGQTFKPSRKKVVSSLHPGAGYILTRVPSWSWSYHSFAGRIFSFSVYFLFALFSGFFRKRFDIVYASSPSPLTGLAGMLLSILYRAPFVLEIRDLWPESARDLQLIRSGFLYYFARKLSLYLYHRASLIIALTASIKARLSSLVKNKTRISVITNGFDEVRLTEAFPGRPSFIPPDSILVLYAGSIGRSQPFEMLKYVAKEFEKQKIHFLIIGDGPSGEEVRKSLSVFSNISFLDALPNKEILNYILGSDIILVMLRDIPVFHGALPNKMFDALACGKPVLMSIDGEAADLLKKSRSGIHAKAGDPSALASALKILAENAELRARLGQNGKKFFERNLSRKKLACRLNSYLQEVLKSFHQQS